MFDVVFFEKTDIDSIVAAWICSSITPCQLIPLSAGEPLPNYYAYLDIVLDRKILSLGLSLPFPFYSEVKLSSRTFREINRDIPNSISAQVWQLFYDAKPPLLVNLIALYFLDEEKDSIAKKVVCSFKKFFPLTLQGLNSVMSMPNPVETLLSFGDSAVDELTEQLKSLNPFPVLVEDCQIPVSPARMGFQLEYGRHLLDTTSSPLVATCAVKETSSGSICLAWELQSIDPAINCHEIASRFGGGGGSSIATFQTELMPISSATVLSVEPGLTEKEKHFLSLVDEKGGRVSVFDQSVVKLEIAERLAAKSMLTRNFRHFWYEIRI